MCRGFLSGVARQTKPKKGPKRKSSWISPIFVNSGVVPWENKHDSHWTFVPECPRENFMNWPFFGLVCRGHSWSCCINLGGFCRGLSWRILLGTFPTKMRKNPAIKSAKSLAAPKVERGSSRRLGTPPSPPPEQKKIKIFETSTKVILIFRGYF